MKKSKFSEEQSATALRQIDAGVPHLSGRRAHGAAHAPPKIGQSSAGRAPAPEPGE
jgi:hypothetical protein